MEPFIGQIQLFPYNFAPRSWAPCNGQLLPIAQNTALFSLIGTFYGGDGRTTFALPDLRGRVPVGAGHGPGLSNWNVGQQGGSESNTITTQQMPSHNHTFSGTVTVPVSAEDADQDEAAGKYLANGTFYHNAADASYGAGPIAVAGTVGNAGGGTPVNNIQPSLGMHYCIALQGIFPSRS